jgi:hypothetical protein
MTARSIRRAQERKQKKLARKAILPNVVATEAAAAPECVPFHSPMNICFESASDQDRDAGIETPASPARIAANQANAKLSTGPKTPAGKTKASLNAVKTALTGRTVLLATDDVAEYERHMAAYERDFRPSGPQESALVHSLAAIAWRLDRIPVLEMAIFAKGHLDFANLFEDHDPSLRRGLIELHTFMVYEKQLRNLQLQEARLARRREKETAELRTLQQLRKQRELREMDSAAKLYLTAKQDGKSFDPAALGFEFSTHEIERFLARQRPQPSVFTCAT